MCTAQLISALQSLRVCSSLGSCGHDRACVCAAGWGRVGMTEPACAQHNSCALQSLRVCSGVGMTEPAQVQQSVVR